MSAEACVATPPASPALPPASGLGAWCDRSFRAALVPDHDRVARSAIHALRFQVYCLDRGFLPAADHPTGEEHDACDQRSLHVLAHAVDGRVAGSVRLVRSQRPGDLPCEEHACFTDPRAAQVDRGAAGEVSRLVVHREFRGGPGGGGRSGGTPLILLALYRRLFQASRAAGVRWWFAAMERPHARAMAGLGFTPAEIGPGCDYYGPVWPYLFDLDEVEAELARCQPALLAWFQEG